MNALASLGLVFALALALIAWDTLSARLRIPGPTLTRGQAWTMTAWALVIAAWAVPSLFGRAEQRAADAREARAAVRAAQDAEAEFKASVAGLDASQLRAAANRF